LLVRVWIAVTMDESSVSRSDGAGAPAGEGGWAVSETVNDVQPPRCFTCDAPLTTSVEINRMIDFGMDLCQSCAEADERDACWCSYGWYLGGDPRQFEPDEENGPEEIAAWRAACEAWERGEAVEPAAEEHGPWKEPATGRISLGERPSASAVGICSAPRAYGVGTLYCEQHPAAPVAWKSWPLDHAALARGTDR
jgi:hypothetical protein